MNLWQAGKVVSVFLWEPLSSKGSVCAGMSDGGHQVWELFIKRRIKRYWTYTIAQGQHSSSLAFNTLFFVFHVSLPCHRTINTLFVSLTSWLKLLWMPSAHQSHILFSVPTSSSSTLTYSPLLVIICDVTGLLVRTEGSHAPQTRRSGKRLSGSHSGY